MVGDLIMLPVRISVRATRLWLRAAEETVNVAASATGRLMEMTSRGSSSPTAAPPRERNGSDDLPGHSERSVDAPGERSMDIDTIKREAEAALQRPVPDAAPGAQPSRSRTGAEQEPAHVSEEPALVEEFAEPGAEDGAGAEVHVEEPWDGYAGMTAKQVVTRLGAATPAELAAVQLFESGHRKRQTILNAVQRELRNANGRSSRTQ